MGYTKYKTNFERHSCKGAKFPVFKCIFNINLKKLHNKTNNEY